MPEQQTPYAAPQATLDDGVKPLEVVAVGRGVRFANFIIDYFVSMFFSGFMLGVIALILGDEELYFLEEVPDLVLGVVIFLVYYIPLEGMGGRTIGKYITGTRVVNEHGLKPTFQQIVGRTFARLIPFEPFSFFRSEGRGWHDTMSKTYVVKCR